jgi:hypothetical protein
MPCYLFSAWNRLKKYPSHDRFSSHSIGTKLLKSTSFEQEKYAACVTKNYAACVTKNKVRNLLYDLQQLDLSLPLKIL